MMTVTPDDLTQTYMVAKNEVIKFLRSRKFMLYGLLVVAIVALMTLLPYALGDGLSGSGGDIFSGYVGYASLLVLLGATLFASYSIVSEFEERTALILFTRPLRKSTIFLGKFAACFALTGVIMVMYYAVSLVIAFAVSGELVTSFSPSLAMCLLYVFATTGVAMLISSVMKKGGTSAVMTFVTILLLIGVVSTVMSASGIDTWFMLDSAASSISFVSVAALTPSMHKKSFFVQHLYVFGQITYLHEPPLFVNTFKASNMLFTGMRVSPAGKAPVSNAFFTSS